MLFFFLSYFIDFKKRFFQFGQSKTLSRIIRVFIEKTYKKRTVLPIGVFKFHVSIITLMDNVGKGTHSFKMVSAEEKR